MRRALFAVAAVVLLAAGYVAVWFVGAGMVRDRIDQWVDDQRAEGAEIEIGDLRVGGFPVRFAAHASDFRVRTPDGLGWRGDAVHVGAPVWNWSTFAVRIDDSLTATLPSLPPTTLTAAGGDGTIVLEGGGAVRSAQINLNDLIVLVPGMEGVRIGAAELHMSPPQAHADGSRRTALRLDLRQIQVPADASPLSADPAFASPVEHVTARVAPSAPPPEAMRVPFLAAWRDRGGDLLVEEFAMVWGPLGVDATGLLGLDAGLQPEGRLTANISGLPETIDSLQRSGLLTPQVAQMLRLGSTMVSGGSDGSTGAVSMPMSIADGTLSVGPLPLLRLPTVAWPP